MESKTLGIFVLITGERQFAATPPRKQVLFSGLNRISA